MIITLAVRALQIIFAAIVLALSVVLIDQYGPGHAPSLFDYGAFCGGAALIIGLIGIVAVFFDKLGGIITLALDGLAAFFLLAGGLAFAIKLKVGSCTDTSTYGYLANHGAIFVPSLTKYYPGVGDNEKKQANAIINDTENRCRMAQADTAFVWFTFACALGAVALSFVNRKSGGRGSIV